MSARDLIAAARHLGSVSVDEGWHEWSCRRAFSTAYYALFHCLAECCANTLVGSDDASRRRPEWVQAYRALGHGTLRARNGNQARMQDFPDEIRKFMATLVGLQERRESADYDPNAVGFTRSAVEEAIKSVEDVIRGFNGVPAGDQRAFAVYVLTEPRKNI